MSIAAFRKPARVPGTERPIVVEFLVGYAALWLLLTAMTENQKTADLAAALAGSIALGATFLYIRDATAALGLATMRGEEAST